MSPQSEAERLLIELIRRQDVRPAFLNRLRTWLIPIELRDRRGVVVTPKKGDPEEHKPID